jgi:hypothetical protein
MFSRSSRQATNLRVSHHVSDHRAQQATCRGLGASGGGSALATATAPLSLCTSIPQPHHTPMHQDQRADSL